MASRDIVNQMTDEMGMNQQMLQNMQQQQMHQMTGPAPGYPPAVDFGQLSPEQQMHMMQQAAAPQHPPMSDDDTISTSSSSSSRSAPEMNLEKLGLGVSSNRGFFDSILNFIKDPIIVVIIFILVSLPALDGFLRPMLPYAVGFGIYYIAIKAGIAGLLYFLIKLVIA